MPILILSGVKKRKVPWWLAGGIAPGDCLGAWRAKGAASYAASLVNLTGAPAYDLAEGVAPDWAAGTGWTFNGTDDYLKTGVIPTVTTTLIVRFSSLNLALSRYMIGVVNGVEYFGVGPNAAKPSWGIGNNTWLNWGAAATSGVMALGGDKKTYWNGAFNATIVAAYTGNASEMYLGCRNSGSATSFCSFVCEAAAVYSALITEAQILAVTTEMNAF